MIRILPLGNSITYDQRNIDPRSTGEKISYRYKLYTLLTQAGYNFDFIGSYRSGYNYFEDCDNSGFRGIDTKDMADLIATGTSELTGMVTDGPYLNYYPADIILLEIGTNDMVKGKYSVTEINNLLNSVDQYELQSGNPVLVIIGTIISVQNQPCGSHPGVKLFNNNLKTLVQNRINDGDNLILVDMECGAGIDYYNEMWDNLHPNPAGYDKMGQKWFEVINSINARPVVYDIPDQQITEGSNFAPINLNSYVNDGDPDDAIVWTMAAEPQYLDVTINPAGIATVMPKDPEWTGTETVTFVAIDPGMYIPELDFSDQDDVTFEITPVNDRPQIIAQTKTVIIYEDESYEITLDDLDIYDPDDPKAGLSIIILPGTNYEYSGPVVTPLSDFNGDLKVKLVVTDGNDLSNIFEFLIKVDPVNDPPVITSVPNTEGDDYVNYFYRIVATDPENEVITYDHIVIPPWAEFDHTTGILYGIPRFNNLGDFEVILTASDGTNTVSQFFTIYVSDINDIPQFTSVPDTLIHTGELYNYTFSATDIDEDDVLTFTVTEKPGWLEFADTERRLSGHPDTADEGVARVVIRVSDGKDIVEQSFKVHVSKFTSTRDNVLHRDINIYPLPAKDRIFISSNDAVLLQASIYNMSGTMIMSKKFNQKADTESINISDLEAGLYLIQIITDRGMLVKKIMVE